MFIRGKPFARFVDYEEDEAEPLQSLAHLRFSSQPAEVGVRSGGWGCAVVSERGPFSSQPPAPPAGPRTMVPAPPRAKPQARHCPRIRPGTRVTGFKRSKENDIWVDAEVVDKQRGRHAGGKCDCRSALAGWRGEQLAGGWRACRLAVGGRFTVAVGVLPG